MLKGKKNRIKRSKEYFTRFRKKNYNNSLFDDLYNFKNDCLYQYTRLIENRTDWQTDLSRKY